MFGEFCFEVFGREVESDVHVGTVIFVGGSGVELGCVDGLVEFPCFFDVDFFDSGYAALFFEPACDEGEEVDAEAGWGVEHGVVVDVGLVAEDGGDVFWGLLGEVFSYDDEGNAGGAHVFLRASVDESEFGDIDWAGEDVGGHVGYEGRFGVGEGMPLCAGDGFVAGDVEVGGGVGFLQVGGKGYGGRAVGYGVSDDVNFAGDFCFGDGFFGPGTGVRVVGGLTGRAEVHGEHGELLGCAAL